ncbi:hypothetical protein [Kribbella amoyensis]|uniref:hypothetical protein n=1 Tax=Kribbella amoyensis TaxID=996641 RepID=UPI00192E1C68|nr:hypothetical protein [Kribbella amoyensis]
MESSGWVAVRCVFRLTIEGSQVYEERVTLWHARDADTAIVRAEAEAEEYAAGIDAEYVGLAQGYVLSDAVADGAEVFSLLRTSPLDAESYLDRYFATGAERQSQLE